MIRRASLKLRLFLLIFTPLIIMAALLGYWRFTVAQKTAEDLFDKSLLAAALAISRDVVMYDGDAILSSTLELIRDAAGGEVFYHAMGPGGIYVTGYAYPPANLDQSPPAEDQPWFFEATYRGQPVRVLQITEYVPLDNVRGNTTVTVWQNLADRRAFVRQLSAQAAALMGGLLATLAFAVWFGVNLGLRPLTDLQQAIAMRSPDDLARIKRAVPVETRGIVQTLNRLFGQVERSMEAHQTFISDAAHQLRNPSAAVQSMAEAVRDASSQQDMDQRLHDLVKAARNSARVAEQLLSLERLRHPLGTKALTPSDITDQVRRTCEDIAPFVLSQGVDFSVDLPDQPVPAAVDAVLLAEALKNLIMNSLSHGGETLSSISVQVETVGQRVGLRVADDGKGLAPEDQAKAFDRFSQLEPSGGSGLGLSIAASIAQHHNGRLEIDEVPRGACLTLWLPVL